MLLYALVSLLVSLKPEKVLHFKFIPIANAP